MSGKKKQVKPKAVRVNAPKSQQITSRKRGNEKRTKEGESFFSKLLSYVPSGIPLPFKKENGKTKVNPSFFTDVAWVVLDNVLPALLVKPSPSNNANRNLQVFPSFYHKKHQAYESFNFEARKALLDTLPPNDPLVTNFKQVRNLLYQMMGASLVEGNFVVKPVWLTTDQMYDTFSSSVTTDGLRGNHLSNFTDYASFIGVLFQEFRIVETKWRVFILCNKMYPALATGFMIPFGIGGIDISDNSNLTSTAQALNLADSKAFALQDDHGAEHTWTYKAEGSPDVSWYVATDASTDFAWFKWYSATPLASTWNFNGQNSIMYVVEGRVEFRGAE